MSLTCFGVGIPVNLFAEHCILLIGLCQRIHCCDGLRMTDILLLQAFKSLISREDEICEGLSCMKQSPDLFAPNDLLHESIANSSTLDLSLDVCGSSSLNFSELSGEYLDSLLEFAFLRCSLLSFQVLDCLF